LDFSSGCIPTINIQARALGWQSVNGSWIGIRDESGSNPPSDKGQPSDSQFRSERSAPARRWNIVIVEDNPSDVLLIREALETGKVDAEVRVLNDGEQAIWYFDVAERKATSCPDLVILDINVPKRQGSEILRRIREGGRCSSVPVVVVTTSGSERDHKEMVEMGASGYFRKPSNFTDFMKLGDLVKGLLATGSK
jgi:chemotaxis family two-component system response regulator Rcp1